MPNRTEARPAKAVLTYATGRLSLLRLFSTPLNDPDGVVGSPTTYHPRDSGLCTKTLPTQSLEDVESAPQPSRDFWPVTNTVFGITQLPPPDPRF